MADPNDPCLACGIVAGEVRTPGGIVHRGAGFTVHAPADPCPIAGWMIVTSDRHVRGAYDLTDAEAAALGPLLARVMRAQQAALGAVHAYLFAIGDVLRHAHVHVVPRFAATPAHLRGRGAFDAAPEDMVDAQRLGGAAERLRDALASR